MYRLMLRPMALSEVIMFYRHLVLLVLATSLVCASEDSQREKLRSELKEASKELERFSRAVNLIHELVAPSVVSIHTKEQRLYANFRSRELTKLEVEVGEGSGFVFHSNEQASWIITNAHVPATSTEPVNVSPLLLLTAIAMLAVPPAISSLPMTTMLSKAVGLFTPSALTAGVPAAGFASTTVRNLRSGSPSKRQPP